MQPGILRSPSKLPYAHIGSFLPADLPPECVPIGEYSLLRRSRWGKDPSAIDGEYPLTLQNFPGCENSKPLLLRIEQSGIYLTAFFSPEKSNDESAKTTEKKPSLMGQFENKSLTLSGAVAQSQLCDRPLNKAAGTGSKPVKIQGQIEGENLKGKITLDSTPVEFTAQRKALIENPATH